MSIPINTSAFSLSEDITAAAAPVKLPRANPHNIKSVLLKTEGMSTPSFKSLTYAVKVSAGEAMTRELLTRKESSCHTAIQNTTAAGFKYLFIDSSKF
jgi:hypothetical protein